MSFDLDIRKFQNKIKRASNTTIRKTTLAAYGGVIRGTRVDTGAARLNWNVNLGSIDYTTRTAPKNAPAKGAGATGNETRASGALSASIKIKAGDLSDVFISNNLPYINSLEDLDHMVRDTTAEIKRKIEQGALL